MIAPSTGRCPCGGAAYQQCCGRFHRGDAEPSRAEQVMRARYSAFAVGDAAYLAHTWHPDTRPRRIHVGDDVTWQRLDVLATTGGDLLDAEGTVTFAAHHERGGRPGVVEERSLFRRHHGRWVYVGADLAP